MGQAVIIIVLAYTGYKIFSRFGLVSPAIMGPIVFVGAYQVFIGGLPEIPSILLNVFQIVIGLSVGAKINYSNLQEIKKASVPSLLIALYTILLTGIMFLLIRNFTSGPATALFSAAPGGISEMTIIAVSYHAEIAIISAYQFVRLLVIYITIPVIVKLISRKTAYEEEETKIDADISEQSLSRKRIINFIIGAGGGIILLVLNFPAGGVVGSIAALGIVNIIGKEESYYYPQKPLKVAFLGIGTTIGLAFSHQMILEIKQMAVPIIVFSLIIVLSNLLISWFIQRFTKWGIITSILCSSPGGLSQMIAIGEDLHANTLAISVLQLVRLLTIITLIPIIAVWLFQ